MEDFGLVDPGDEHVHGYWDGRCSCLCRRVLGQVQTTIPHTGTSCCICTLASNRKRITILCIMNHTRGPHSYLKFRGAERAQHLRKHERLR